MQRSQGIKQGNDLWLPVMSFDNKEKKYDGPKGNISICLSQLKYGFSCYIEFVQQNIINKFMKKC